MCHQPKIKMENFPMLNTQNTILEIIKKRRTIRKYLDKPISEEHINLILDAARWAPSAANLQPWQFIVVKGKFLKNRIQGLVEENRQLTISQQVEPFKSGFSRYETSWISEAPIHIVVCADPRRTAPHANGEETYKYAAGAAIQNLMLAAFSLGLGTCWLTMFDKSKLKALLVIPPEIDVIGVITVGHPREVPEVPETSKKYGTKPRFDLKEIVFYEQYGNRSS